MRRVLQEPLLQFLVIGALLFGAYALLQGGRSGEAPETIVVTPGRVAQLAETFSRTWQRPPTSQELGGLIDAFVKEEIFYREGRKLGLDVDDTIFRRRLQQKMEFLMEPGEAELTPEEGELQAYLDENRAAFRIPEHVAFEQVFLDPARHGESLDRNARKVLDELRKASDGSIADRLGDATLLPAKMPLTPIDRIAISFGQEFADRLQDAPVGKWEGPIRSTFGLHFVRIGDRAPGREPELSEVLEEVSREWETEKRRSIAADRYAELRKRYEVVIEGEAAGTSAAAARVSAQ